MTQLRSVPVDALGLVLVDVQRVFASAESPLSEDGLDMSGTVERVPNVRSLLAEARGAEIPVAFTRSVRRPDGKDAPQRTYDIVPAVYRESDPICLAGARETEYVDGVEPADDEYEVEKVRYDAFFGTRLESFLRYEGVETVLFAGFTTNVCVESTARSAHERGFNVAVVADCCGSFSPEQHESALRNVDLAFGETVRLDDVAEVLSR